MINIPHSNSIKEINLTRELVITWPNSNCVFKGLFYETKILTIQYSNEKEIHNRNSKIPICNRYNLDAFPIQIDEVKKINFIASESIVKKITFEEEVKEVLRTKNRIETAQLLWKCAVRNLPFLGMAGNFNYWKAGNVQSHLYSVFNALDLAYYVSYSNSLSTFLAEDFRWDAYESAYAIEHYSIFALNAAEKYNATETDVNYASAINIVSDAINTIVSATSFIISEFINNHPTLDLIYPTYLAEPAHIITRIPKFSSSKLSIKQNILADAKNKIKIKIDIEDYGEIWDKFQNAMINVDCGYWANLYKGIFENNFEIDADELEKRLKLPDQIKKEGAAAVGQYLQQLLKGREHFNEARVIILGEKGAGKTCLARKLINPAASLTKEGKR